MLVCVSSVCVSVQRCVLARRVCVSVEVCASSRVCVGGTPSMLSMSRFVTDSVQPRTRCFVTQVLKERRSS